MQKYGQTWWGNQWLNALSDIDYSNRLPRGRSYANKGAVREINIKGNTIVAKVTGSRSAPYKVKIKVPGFAGSEKRALTGAITDNPLLLSKLLNRELPPHLNSIADRFNIEIFPKRWSDFEMKCSCPDWAVPCKHLAAVINVVASEIDRNPFLVFKLHDYDIVAELNKEGMAAVTDKVTIHRISHMPVKDEPYEEYDFDLALLDTIDFSEIEDIRDDLFALLSPSPLFYNSDFRVVLEKIYKKTSKKIAKETTLETRENEYEINFEIFSDARLILSNELFFSEYIMDKKERSISYEKPADMLYFLSAIPSRYFGRLSPRLMLMNYVRLFAQKLAEKSAFIPQIVSLADGYYTIRWLPALVNEKVRQIFDKLVKACPPLTVTGAGMMELSPEDQVKNLVSIFIRQYISSTSYDVQLEYSPVSRMFISEYSYPFDKPGETEVPFTIQRWIDKLYLSQHRYRPVLEIHENEKKGFFGMNILVENSREPLKEPVPLAVIMNEPAFINSRVEILRTLELISHSFPALEEAITTSGNTLPVFGPEEFAELLFKILPVIRLYGIRITLPNALKELARPRATVSLSSNGSVVAKSFLNLDKILEFRWKVAIGDTIVDKEEFLSLVKGLSGIVKIKQQYVYLNPADLKTLMESFARQEKLDRNKLLQAAITGELNDAVISIDKETRLLIDSLMQVRDIELAHGIMADLRPYQKRGYDWLVKNAQLGFGSIIADDMGLGKTLQVIALLMKLRNEGSLEKHKALVIVPTTLLTNWRKEIEKFAPSLTFSIYHGPNRILDTSADLVITSYGIARSDNQELALHHWKAVVIDEAQNIKNSATAQTKAVKKLKADIRIAMSGTPVENRLSEYWSIFDFTIKGYLGNIKSFTTDYAVPIEVNRNRKRLDKFLKITGPFILRRLKSDKTIITDLPEKVENDYYASLVKEQAAIYQNVLNNLMEQIENVDVTEKEASIQRKGLVLTLIMALKQICNHPSQYLKKEDSSPELSGKAGIFLDLLENIIENDEKALVFTQFREMGELLQKMIRSKFDIEPMFLHGGTSRKNRDEMVEQFQNNKQKKIFILSIKAGGTGLNLTAASHVIHYDLWWNPAVESQATDRAYRIGQKKNVMVYRLITRGTFEEKISAMIENKKELAKLTVTAGEKWVGDLSAAELKQIFKLS